VIAEPATALTLRPYQVEALEAIAAAERRDLQRVLEQLPTGCGKTVVFVHLISDRRDLGRALVLVHRDELVQQTLQKLHAVAPDLDVGVVKAERNDVEAHVVVASVQTLSRPSRLARLGGGFATIIVDEAHHATANSYVAVLRHLGAWDDDGPLTVGFTATPQRADGVGLGEVFEEIVYRKRILEMVEDGYLCDLRALEVRLQADFRQLHTRAGDFVDRDSEELLLNANAPEHAVQAFVEHAAERKALLFTPTVRVAHAMAAAFRGAGIPAEAIDGAMPLDQRRAVLERLHEGDTRVVANCAVLVEGFDEPSIDAVIIARPTRSQGLYVQMIGRATRTYPGKDDALIIDLVGATNHHDLVTTASLFGLSRDEVERGSVAEAFAERRRVATALEARGQLVARAVDLFNRRALRWVHAGDRFALTLPDGWIALEPNGTSWDVIRATRQGAREILGRGLDLTYGQGVAEDYVRRAGSVGLVHSQAAWRQRPASAKQVALLTRLGKSVRPGIRAGEASDMITTAMVAGVG